MYVALTIFANMSCTKIARVVHLQGEPAANWLRRAAEILGREPKQNDMILSVRIDRIGDTVEAWG